MRYRREHPQWTGTIKERRHPTRNVQQVDLEWVMLTGPWDEAPVVDQHFHELATGLRVTRRLKGYLKEIRPDLDSYETNWVIHKALEMTRGVVTEVAVRRALRYLNQARHQGLG